MFITEYMSSGSLKTFLRKAKKTKQNLSKNSWRRWCIQLLSALKYLNHSLFKKKKGKGRVFLVIYIHAKNLSYMEI